LAFLPDGRMLVTERPGRLRLIAPSKAFAERVSRPIAGVPKVDARGQGGLLDVAVDPDFTKTHFIYLSYAEPRGGGRNATSVARGRLNEAGTRLENVTVIFRQQPAYRSTSHFGSRLVFDRTGMLYVTTGERYGARRQAQNPANHLGKIIRIRPEGGAAPGNPQKPGWAVEIWSIGHRNVQGAALHPKTGELWTAEHGAAGGDEINIPRKGRNYGWPVITYGRDYSGAKIGIGTHKRGMEQPVYYWDPSIAPSGMAFYTGDKFPAWTGNAFIGALAGQLLTRVVLSGEKVVHEERMLQGLHARIRDVRQGPDGFLYLLTDATDGRVVRLRAAGTP
jgi:glucose/arabinose dehydrogenase